MLLILLVFLPFVAALAIAMASARSRGMHALIAGSASGMGLAIVAAQAFQPPQQIAIDWVPALGLNLTIMADPLGLFFAGLILGIGLLVVNYAHGYLGKAEPTGRFLAFLMLFQGAMVGIVLSGNVLMTLVFWELTSLSSFLLISFWRDRADARQGARMALAVTGGGGLALIGGPLLL